MKKAITICLLVITLLAGGMTMDAKTTKKKGKAKARTTQTTSSKWNGDIPSASFLADTFFFGYDHPNNGSTFKSHGYTIREEYGSVEAARKEGVCEMEVENYAKTIQLEIKVYDSADGDWLYNNICNYIKSKGKRSGLIVSKEGNEITFMLSSEW